MKKDLWEDESDHLKVIPNLIEMELQKNKKEDKEQLNQRDPEEIDLLNK